MQKTAQSAVIVFQNGVIVALHPAPSYSPMRTTVRASVHIFARMCAFTHVQMHARAFIVCGCLVDR